MSASGQASLEVRGADGGTRTVNIAVPDAAQRHHLTEPSELLQGLGFGFWIPTPAVLGKVNPGGLRPWPVFRSGTPSSRSTAVRIDDFQHLANHIHARPDEHVALDYRRGGVLHSAVLLVARGEVNGKTLGRIQVEPAPPGKLPESVLVHTSLGPLAALGAAVNEAWDKTVMQARSSCAWSPAASP